MALVRSVAIVAISIIGFATSCLGANADSVAQFYKGKTISLTIGYSPGGTDDLWARLIARRLGTYLPGHPNVVPVNVPGAGSLLLANEIYNTLPQDGTVVGLINRGLPFEKLLGGPGIQFDARKMQWIGSPDVDTDVCAARKDAAVQTLADLQTKQLVVGATGSGADSAIDPKVLANLLGLKLKIVTGYPGSHDIALAVEKGEVQGYCVVYSTIARAPYFKRGKLNIILQLAAKPDSRIPHVPLASSLAKSTLDKQALNFFVLRSAVGRPFVAGPKVPHDRVTAIRDAFAKTMKDPVLLKDAQNAGIHAHYLSAQTIADVIAGAYATPQAAIDHLKNALGQ